MEPSESSPVDSVHPSPPMDAIESIREMYKNTDPMKQIDPLITFLENQLQKMNTSSEAGSSSSEGCLATDGAELAAKTINTISTEAERLSNSDPVKALGTVTCNVMEKVGDVYWVFIGLSLAVYSVEKYMSVSSTEEEEYREHLLNILEHAKEITQYSKQMSDDKEKLLNTIGTIVEGVVIFYDYMKMGKNSRFLSAKTNQQLRDVMNFVGLLDFQPVDVFLSHSGKQKNFVRQLRVDLTREYVSCFFDEDRSSLPFGQKFPPLLVKAAETCKIAVVVLSKDFISSKWPMIELLAFITAKNSKKNAKLEIIPIFYEIIPGELNDITKDFPEWKELKVSNYTRAQWEIALKEVRPIHGMVFSKGGDEVHCRNQVVKEIRRILSGIKPPELLEFEPVGIEEQVRDVKALLDMEGSQSALAVNVCGFGGMGKSTVAASAVQSLNWSSLDFKFCRVAINRKETNKTSHIKYLQKVILSYLAGVNDDLRDTLDGRLKIKKALVNKRSLLLIDNVVDNDDIKELLPEDLSYSGQNTKLRIIITCRQKIVKAKLNITWKEHEVKGLSHDTSKSFLSKTIKKGQKVENLDPDEEERLINKVASKCRGVPLLLSVFGQHLRVERNKDSYLEALEILREGNLNSYRDEDLGPTLMHVYDKIKDKEVKDVFLDICAYFHGWKWNLVADIVETSKLNDLQGRMLVSKGGSGEVIVHDILLLMGMKEAEDTRFSNWEKLSDALEGNLNGSVIVQGISLLVNKPPLITIQSTQLEAMRQSLRVLMLGDWVTLEGPPSHKAFPNLRYLHVGDMTTFPFKDPAKLDKLRFFRNRSKPGRNLSNLPSGLKHISHKAPALECDKFVELPFQNLSLLKSVKVKTSISSVELPDELHLPSSLVDLYLKGCKNLPKDMGQLICLESLILDNSDLKFLPQGFCKLKRLKNLSLKNCTKLTFLCEELGMLSSLEVLSMEGCANLRALPESLGGLSSLQTLEINKCTNLQELPEGLGELRIQSLELHWLFSLKELPNSFGKMPLLKDLTLISCRSLMSLPENFSRLRCLTRMIMENCCLLKELPYEFGAVPALKTFRIADCNSIVNLSKCFTGLTSLEELDLWSLRLSRIPDGFGKLKKLRSLCVSFCAQLKTLPDDFENMAALERLKITECSELDGAMMEKIVKLPNCYMADIGGSTKLIEKWKHMQGETEHLILVEDGVYGDRYSQRTDVERAIRVALMNGKCMEVNSSDQVVERSSLLVGLEEGITATVALILLPIDIQPDEHRTSQEFLKKARERAESNRSGKLQIVCARKADLDAKEERPTATVEEEEEGIRQILLPLPKESCVIPCSESKRIKVLTECCKEYVYRSNKSTFFMVNVGVDKKFTTWERISESEAYPLKFTTWERISESEASPPTMRWENKRDNSIEKFIKSICDPRGQSQNRTRAFTEALKKSGIDSLLANNTKSQLMVDDLHGKAIGFIISDLHHFELIRLQQIYEHVQQKDSDFIWIWIPSEWPENCGHGSYTRLIQCMPWATFPCPSIVDRIIMCGSRQFVVVDKQGQISNQDAWSLIMGWGVESYPFTRRIILSSVSSAKSESCLECLLHGMNIERRMQMKSKMTFLYAVHPREWVEMKKCKLEELTQIDGSFEVLYVGNSYNNDIKEVYEDATQNIKDIKEVYEDATQNMSWPSLSFSDMIMFWHRLDYFRGPTYFGPLFELVEHLEDFSEMLVLFDDDGQIVTCRGDEVCK